MQLGDIKRDVKSEWVIKCTRHRDRRDSDGRRVSRRVITEWNGSELVPSWWQRHTKQQLSAVNSSQLLNMVFHLTPDYHFSRELKPQTRQRAASSVWDPGTDITWRQQLSPASSVQHDEVLELFPLSQKGGSRWADFLALSDCWTLRTRTQLSRLLP